MAVLRARASRLRTAAIAAGFVIVAAVWTASGFHRAAAVDVETVDVTAGSIVHHVVATGTLQAISTVAVGAQVSGTVEALSADYNSIVHRGDVLARIDPALLQAALGEAQAALAQAEAGLGQARANRAALDTAVVDAQTKLTNARAPRRSTRRIGACGRSTARSSRRSTSRRA